MRDMANDVSVAATITPIVVNNDTEGTGVAVDLAGYESATLIVHVGVSGDTLSGSVYHTVKLQESATTTSGDFTDVAAGDCIGTNGQVIDDAAEDDVVIKLGYVGNKRYVRAFIDTTGTHTNGTPIGAVVVRGRTRHLGGPAV